MRATRSEAFGIFHKWFSEGSLLSCHFSFHKFAVALRGRIFAMNDTEIKLVSDDRLSEMALRITADLEFGYGDSRQSPEDASRYDSAIVVFFSSLSDKGEPDIIGFAEVLERT